MTLDEASELSSAWPYVDAYARAQGAAIDALSGPATDAEPDAVHKMRVACRRLRSTLRTFRPYVDRDRADVLRDELRWLAGELSVARDVEVVAAELSAAVAAEPADQVIGPVAETIESTAAADAAAAHERVRAALDSSRFDRLGDEIDAVLNTAAPATASELRSAVRIAVRRVDRRLARDPGSGPERADVLHEARKTAKRARYGAEAVCDLAGEPACRLASAMTELQDVLGAHHDAINAQRVLTGLAERARRYGDSVFTYELLRDRQREAAEAVLTRLPDAVRGIGDPAVRAWLD